MSVLSVDFETRSRVDLRKSGVYRYAQDPSTDIWCMAFAFDDEEPELWVPPWSIPQRVVNHVRQGRELRAWNAQFERVVWALILGPRYGFPVPKREQWYCTAAEAAAMSLPRALEKAARVLNVGIEKDDEGRRLMMKMTKPRRPTKKDPREWWDDPADVARLGEYCKQDVRVERAIAQRIRRLSDYERQVYLLDQKINDRGVLIDAELVRAAQKIVATGLERANTQLEALTDGEVSGVTKVADLTRWLQYRGIDTDNVRKDTLRDLLGEDDLPEDVREAIEIRSESAKTSTAKLESMILVPCRDGRARGLTLYHGAGTGRWAGRLIQPQNFPRGEYWRGTELTQIKDVEKYIPLVLAGDYDAVDAEHPALVVIAALLRRMLLAAPGHRFIAGDYAGIEARVLAWIAGQDDLVHAFATGAKIYERMAAFIQSRKLEREVAESEIAKESVERQIGKNTILGSGFQMGWKTFQRQVKVQTGIDISDEDAQLAIASYRDLYPRIPQFWRDIERAAMQAVATPGRVTQVGHGATIKYAVRGQFLWCVLPSGRVLAYARPEIRDRKTPWGEMRPAVTFMAEDSLTRKWRRHDAYGGLWTENVVQAMARDLIAAAMVRLEAAGYRPVLSVHDEVLSEPAQGHGSLEEYLSLMKVRPRWAAGLPVAVDGWEGERYRK